MDLVETNAKKINFNSKQEALMLCPRNISIAKFRSVKGNTAAGQWLCTPLIPAFMKKR